MKSRQAKSGKKLPPTLAMMPDRRSMVAAPAVAGPLEELPLPLVVLVDTVELVPAPAPPPVPVVGLGEPAVSEPEVAPVADGVELGDCPELADAADVAVALESPEPELPGVSVAELEAAPEDAVVEASAEVDGPLVLPLVSETEDVSVLEADSVVESDVVVSKADDADVAVEDSSLDDELMISTDPVTVLVCCAVVCSASVEVTSAKAEVVEGEEAGVASQ